MDVVLQHGLELKQPTALSAMHVLKSAQLRAV